MLKYIVAVGAIGSFAIGANAVVRGKAGSDPGVGATALSVALEAVAATLNLRKGERRGDATMLGAVVSGKTLIVDYKADTGGRRIDTAATSAMIRNQLKAEACHGPMLSALRSGAAMEVNYWLSPKNNLLFDVRVDSSLCPV